MYSNKQIAPTIYTIQILFSVYLWFLYKKKSQERNTDVVKEGYNSIPIYRIFILFKNSFNTTIFSEKMHLSVLGIHVTTIKNAGREVVLDVFFLDNNEIFSYSFLIYTSAEYTLLIYCVLWYEQTINRLERISIKWLAILQLIAIPS